jgi:hypothetical protein
MKGEGKHLYKKSDIFPFFYDLLHLLMKFYAIRSVGIGKYDNTVLCIFVSHNQSIIQWNQ